MEAQLEADQLTLQGMMLQRHVAGVRLEIVACDTRLRLLGEVLEDGASLGSYHETHHDAKDDFLHVFVELQE